ncbi:MAG: cell division protein ZapA [Ruminococcaceae bacterium]|nr:cell division protein ZapA [Oscillospiraceae bacterium]
MPEKNKLSVKINGREYTIASTESREYMLSVADVVDKNMKEISRTCPELNTTMTAVLAALNLADEYVRLQQAYKKLTKENAANAMKVRELEEQLSKYRRY